MPISPDDVPQTDRRVLRRRRLLHQIESLLETPMLILGFVWLALLVIELVRGLTPWQDVLGVIIWIVFIFDFVLRFSLAPRKLLYLKRNWITALALLIPALRVFRVARVLRVLRLARATRGLRLVRLLTSLNRGLKALRNLLGRRGFGYVAALTVLVTLSGAAGMLAFENGVSGAGKLNTYTEALWWTAMLMTTLGSDFWPQSAEGRILCFFLALYAFTVFGYVTATLASFFIGSDTSKQKPESADIAQIGELRDEIRALREEVQRLRPQESRE